MRRIIFASGITLIGTLVLSACAPNVTSEPVEPSATETIADSESASPEASPDGPSQEELHTYFENLSSHDPQIAAQSIELAAPGSHAEAYATYRASLFQSDRDAGFPIVEESIRTILDGFAMCEQGVSTEDGCANFTNIRHEGNLISDFDIDGQSLGNRLNLGDGQTQSLGELGEAELIVSYQTVSGSVIAVFDITSNEEGLFAMGRYQAPDGRQSQATYVNGPMELSEGAFGTFAFVFEGAEYGGKVTVEPISGEGYSGTPATFELK